MYNFNTIVDAIQDAKKSFIEKLHLAEEVKTGLIETVDTQTVVIKTYYVETEKTMKLLANNFFAGYKR